MGRALSELKLKFATATRTFYFRTDSAGDRGVIAQIFKDNHYDLSRFSRNPSLTAYYHRIVASGRTPLIVDAGANIGASVVYFAGVFPAGKVLAIEPEKNNCLLLRKNCDGLNFSLLEGGIGCRNGSMSLHDPGLSDWGFRLQQDGHNEVPVFAAAELLQDEIRQGLAPFIFKIDIEGGEAELFSENTAWLSTIPLVIIELHDWLFPGKSKSGNFLRAVSSLNVDFVCRGENVFCFNNDLLKSL